MSDVLVALGEMAARCDGRPAFTDPGGSVSFAGLARRVAGAAALMKAMPDTIGLLSASSIDWIVADLAAWAAGKTLVPLPHFFSDAQLFHIIADAGVRLVLAEESQRHRMQAVPSAPIPLAEASWGGASMAGQRIVYTSGSTAAPKGVLLGIRQINHSCMALLSASQAGPSDCHLSVLPYSLLLEAICGIYLPVMAGGRCVIAPDIVAAQGADIAVRLGEAVMREQPTTTVLVPQLVQAWVLAASVGRVSIPDSLRFVAVGGAAVPDAVAARAWDLGIPVHEGYGLTECSSVVAVNRPGDRRAGTVGRVLSGYDVRIADDGEIVVGSRSVASGYLGREDGPDGLLWRTGDLGHFDADGYLHVSGRKDNLIVTSNGRNVAPEWVETMLLADPRIGRCIVLAAPDGVLSALMEPAPLGVAWFGAADGKRLQDLIQALTGSAPDYAVPRRMAIVAPDVLAQAGLLTPNGRPRRREIAARYDDFFSAPLEQSLEMQHAVL